jgi:two-component system sensor histidine kinase DesK
MRSFEAQGAPRWARIGRVVWLGFLVVPFIDFLDESPPTWQIVLSGAGTALFIAGVMLFSGRRGLDSSRKELAWVAMTALATALTLAFGASYGLLFIWTAVIGARALDQRRASQAVIVSTALAVGVTLLAKGDPAQAIFAFGTPTLGVGILMLIIGRLSAANEELFAAREERARLAVAEERLRFSRDLHDLVGHSLSLIALKAQLAGRVLHDDPDRAEKDIAELQAVARDALVEVRQAVSGYRRPTLEGELAGARMALEAAGIDTSVDVPAVQLPAPVDETLAWAVREGTTNVIRHSGADRARIRLVPGLDRAAVEVWDDGRGSDSSNGGHGLTGLRERAEAVSGRVEAGPSEDGGFRLEVSVPVRHGSPAAA